MEVIVNIQKKEVRFDPQNFNTNYDIEGVVVRWSNDETTKQLPIVLSEEEDTFILPGVVPLE